VPALLVLPWVTGALKQRNARRYFISFFAIALTNYLLTDYKAQERVETVPGLKNNNPTRLPR